MISIEDRIKNKFGNSCIVVNIDYDSKKATVSDGEYEYCISVKREIYANYLGYDSMTYESRKKYWQAKFPSNIKLIDIFKEGNKTTEILFFDSNTAGTYLLPFKYEMNYFLSYYENYLKFKIFRETISENIFRKYGKEYVILCADKNNENNVLISDGNYEWSVTTSPFRKTGLTTRSMVKESLIKHHDSKFPDYLNVININERENGYKTLKIIDLRTKKEFNFSYELNVWKIVSVIENVYNHNKTYIDKCKIKYGAKFSYKKTQYIDCLHDVIVTCPIHGDIIVNSGAFLYYNKFGCQYCGNEKRSVFSRNDFIEKCIDNKGYLYLIECESSEENFIKVGITSKDNINKRFKCSHSMPYSFKPILMIESSAYDVYNCEVECLRTFRKNKYKPQIYFKGETECFDISIKQEAICLIQKLLVSSPQVS